MLSLKILLLQISQEELMILIHGSNLFNTPHDGNIFWTTVNNNQRFYIRAKTLLWKETYWLAVAKIFAAWSCDNIDLIRKFCNLYLRNNNP